MTHRVLLSAGALDQITRACAGPERGDETGGILLGHQYPDGLIAVAVAGRPGLNAQSTRSWFRRDPVHARSLAAAAYAHNRSVWLGDWHTHPDGPTHPSPIDLRSYADVLHDAEAGFDVFLAIIVTPARSGPELYPWAVTTHTAIQTGLWVDRATHLP